MMKHMKQNAHTVLHVNTLITIEFLDLFQIFVSICRFALENGFNPKSALSTAIGTFYSFYLFTS